ncbi:MAG: MarR family transcriptional regulator [Microbacterium sp.]|uniref:MarR family winged helix-turn-helix transcriptional regulator n=1 Tax=Microbacterium sp. TaxID=51671 RepID=UPI0039E48A75
MTHTRADRPGDDTRRRAVRELEEAFSELMGEFRRVYTQAAAAASPGMLPGTFKALGAIARLGPVTLSALADRLTADKGLLSRQVTELESVGMIERRADPDDGRVRLIEITPHGRERLAAAREPYQAMLLETLDDWPLSSIDRLTSLIHALASGVVPHADDVFEPAPDSTS